jgi:hypothetical protein
MAPLRKLLTVYDPGSFGPFRPHAMHHVLRLERACALQMLYRTDTQLIFHGSHGVVRGCGLSGAA